MTIGNTYSSFSTFIASPKDVSEERELAKDTLTKINTSIGETLKMSFLRVCWEDGPPMAANAKVDSIQDALNAMVERCHFFILVLHKRYGTVEDGHTRSNTEREMETILAKKKLDKRITILSYFKQTECNTDPGTEETNVAKFKERLKENGVLPKEFTTPGSFKEALTHDLYQLAIKFRVSPYKQECLSNFWRLSGQSSHYLNTVTPDVAVVYRPMNRHNSGENEDSKYWLRRLMPSVAFEDTKAIQKIQKNFRLLGIRSKVYTSSELPPDLSNVNRVWICAPRVPQAIERLADYGDTVRFEFKKTGTAESKLIWTNDHGESMTIRSPLSKYLSCQRNDDELTREWSSKLARTYARDYAIVARFANSEDVHGDGSHVMDYFVAGVRGLGTWGAAWFLDRRYHQLRDWESTSPLQKLLEVTTINGHISHVKDVSAEGKDFFKKRNSKKFIEQQTFNVVHGGEPR